jgi:S-adenosylmethionine uptake transporter
MRNAVFAAVLMIVASALFALQAALVKTGLRGMAPLELVFFRGLICTVAIFGMSRWKGLGLGTARPRGQIALGIVGFASLALYFVSIGMLPLVTATALNYSAPLFIALFVAFYQARATRAALILWATGGFAGVWLILHPSFAGGTSTGVVLALLSGLTAAGGYLLLSKLGREGESERVTGFYFSLIVCVLAGIPTVFSGFSIATLQQVGLVVAIGLLATVGQLAMGRAYAIGSPLIPATVSYSTVVFSSLLGAWWWGDQLGTLETLGVALIVASGILISAGQARTKSSRQQLAFGCGAAQQEDEEERRREYRKNSLRSLYATYKLAKRPDDVKFVFMIGDAQDNIAEGERRQGRIADPFSSTALEQMWSIRYCPQRYDIEDLLALPADTLGGAYARHMKVHGLRPDFYEEVEPRHRLHFLRLRMRQTHDIWHVLTGFSTDEFGEVGLQGFYFAQFTNGQSVLIGAGAMLKSLLRGRFAELEQHVDVFCEGYCNGKRADSLLAVKWEELWGENLETLRRRYGIREPQCRSGTLALTAATA